MGHSDRKMVMSSNELTSEERETLQKFRERVSDISHPEIDNENYLVKWLIARNFNLIKAEDMLRKHVWYIQINDLDKLDENFTPPEATNYFYTALLGYDNEGSLIRVLNIGATDIRAVTLAMSKADSIRHAAFVLICDTAEIKREKAKNDLICDKQAFIMDLKGLTWRSIIHRTVAERSYMLLKNYESNYPENLKIAYIVNAPSFFTWIYNWLKTVLPESILSKIRILSQDECAAVLTKTIDPSILPACYGGLKTDLDGDPRCSSIYAVPLGTPFPESLMSNQQCDVLNNDPLAKKTTIENRSCFKVEIIVIEPGSILNWDFQTAQNDIRIGLNYKEDKSSDSERIIPTHRVDSHRFPESGRFACNKAGIYELIFDNSYSWLTKKELIYKVNVTVPRSKSET